MTFRVPNQYRMRSGPFGTSDADGNNGLFWVKLKHGQVLKVIVSDGAAPGQAITWEHVSVSRRDRCPSWEEMCIVKDLFWSADDCVIQYHPPKSDYVSMHQFCLHLWRPVGVEIPRPPTLMVGIPGVELC